MNIVITGASSGLGHAIWCQIEHGFYFDPNQDVRIFNWSIDQGVDIRHKLTLENAARAIDGPVDILINCAGVNGIDYLPDVKEEDWDRIMDTNAKGCLCAARMDAGRGQALSTCRASRRGRN